MKSPERQGGLVFLDACCLINLFATGRAEEILQALPYDFAISRYVAEEEILEIENEGSKGSKSGEERTSLRPSITKLIDRGLLTQLDVTTTAEERELVRFAVQLDDGEAYTLALAITRGGRVATDDRKALRVFREAWEAQIGPTPGLDPCLRTSELVFEWAGAKSVSKPELVSLVRAVARRASFIPPKNDPHFDRWMALLQQEEN